MCDLISMFSSCAAKLPYGSFQQSPQQNFSVPILQECINAITEHQRLHALMRGEWVKGLLPHSSVRADYMVQRIRGNCMRDLIISYDFLLCSTFSSLCLLLSHNHLVIFL